MKSLPRTINPQSTFSNLVEWFYDLVVNKSAPGFIIGLSGTDSLVAFCAAAKALEQANMSERMLGVHFAPSEDFIYDNPSAEQHLWFRDTILPWLTINYPNTKIKIDESIDWRCDGLRWGSLMDQSTVFNDGKVRRMLEPSEQYWLVGTRNRTENELYNYSNASAIASIQPLIHIWKSEILELSKYLSIPQIAIDKSCETDCICGRERLPSQHIKEVDWLLMAKLGELNTEYLKNIEINLQNQLSNYIINQVRKNSFKKDIPYMPSLIINEVSFSDPLVVAFEDGSLNLNDFNHKKHLYVAWRYLKELQVEVAIERYCHFLCKLLNASGLSYRFSLEITKSYFYKLDEQMKLDENYSII